jgi:hypothetical protein
MSAEHEAWIVAAARRAMRTSDASDVILEAVQRAQMKPEQDALDDLLDEKE